MEIRVPRDRRPAVLQTLRSVLGPTRVAPGCLDARLYSGTDKLKAVMLVEEWQSREEFEHSLDATKINAIVAAVELASEAPIVRVDTVERREGMAGLALYLDPPLIPPISSQPDD
jgi:quinol monooxygenase YgiN